MGSRNDSMNTTTSFVTAREELESDHDGSSTMKGGEVRTLDGTDYVPEEDRLTPQPPPKTRSLGLGLEGLEAGFKRQKAPTQDRSEPREKLSFEDDFASDHSLKSKRGEARDLPNPVLSRNVTITRGKTRRKPYNLVDQEMPTKQPSKAKDHRRRYAEQDITSAPSDVREVLDDTPVLPANATRHLEKHGVHDHSEFGRTPEIKATPRNSQQPEDMSRTHRRSHTQHEKPSIIPRAKQAPALDDPHDVRKFSHGSSRSNSTVEAVVVIQPQQLKARRTLRHKERMGSLRDFSPNYASRVPVVETEYHIPAQRLRHKSVDLSQRPVGQMSVSEKTRQILVDQARAPQQPTKVARPLPPKPEEKEETDEEARIRGKYSFVYSGSEPWEVMDPECHHQIKPAREQTVEPIQEAPRSRQVSAESEQTVIEHPRRSPLPDVPSVRDIIPVPLIWPQEAPTAAAQPPQEPVQSRPPVTLQDERAQRSRRFSIERKPVPQRPRMDSTTSAASNGTVTTNATEKARSRKQLLADGVIPVVIAPRRTSSLKEQSQPPSVRSSKQASRASSTAPLSASAGTNIPGAWPSSYPSSLLGQRRYSDGGASTKSAKMTPKEDGLVRSMDTGPPAIPVRRSSMSAPTTPYGSRNVSRSNSLTADSLRRHNEDQAYRAVSYAGTLDPEQTAPPLLAQQTVSQTIQQRRDENRDSGVGYGVGIATHSHSVRIEKPDSEHQKDSRQRSTHLSVDTNGDPLFGQRLSAQVTPFSAKSDVTGASHGTALEVAEARQVDIFSHQNTSVQLVDQEPPSSSASESIKLRQKSNARQVSGGRPTTSSSTGTAIRPDRPRLESREKYSSTSVTNPSANINGAPRIGNLVPASPPQSGIDNGMTSGLTDSPLINPRQPPAPPVGLAAGPPALKIIPPTPAELAAQEEASKQLGWEPPRDQNGDISRPPRRNWSLRSVEGLVRSLSFGRRNSEKGRNVRDVDVGSGVAAPFEDYEKPAEEGKLHPFWRPANYRDEEEDCDCDECREYWAAVDSEALAAKRSSATDKPERPGMPRRTTSQMSQVSKRLKKTFTILPLAGIETAKDKNRDDGYNVSYATARRTIKRSGSGNLKVVNRVGNVSKESLKLQEYLNRSRRERSFQRNRFDSLRRKVSLGGGQSQGPGQTAVDGAAIKQDTPQTPPAQTGKKVKRFSWVGGSTDSPASKYPPTVRYPLASASATYDTTRPSSGLKRTFSLPGRSRRGSETGTSYPPMVNVEWLSLGGLTRRFSEKRKEEKREGLRRTISAPRGVRDGVEEVLTSRQRADARRERYEREAGVQTEDFGGR